VGGIVPRVTALPLLRPLFLSALLLSGCASRASKPAEIPAAMAGFAQLELEGDGVRYAGVSATEVLQTHFGKAWFTMKAVRFVGADGYKIEVPTADLTTYQPLLATARADGAPFRIVKQEKDVELAPAYLVWPAGAMRPGLWIYQVVRVEAVP
jgi:hypothetical protein